MMPQTASLVCLPLPAFYRFATSSRFFRAERRTPFNCRLGVLVQGDPERLGVHGGKFDESIIRAMVRSLWTGLAPQERISLWNEARGGITRALRAQR